MTTYVCISVFEFLGTVGHGTCVPLAAGINQYTLLLILNVFCVLSTCQIGLFVFIFFQLNISLLSKFSRTWHTCGALKPVWSRSRDKGLGGRTPPFHCSWWWWWWQPSPSVFVFVFVCICIFCICICEWLWCVFDERQRVPMLLLVGRSEEWLKLKFSSEKMKKK